MGGNTLTTILITNNNRLFIKIKISIVRKKENEL